MPGYNQPTESSSRKGVERPPPPARPQPESPLGRVHAIESSVCSDIGPSLTIKQRPEAQQQDIYPARAGPEHPTPPTAKATTGDSLLKRTLGRSVHHDQIDSMLSTISSSNAKNSSSTSLFSTKIPPLTNLPSTNHFSTDFSSKNLSSMFGHIDIKDPRRPMDAVSAGVEGVKQPKTSVFETPGHSAEPAKEVFAPGMVTIRPESVPFQPNMSPPSPSPLKPRQRSTTTMASSPSRLAASRAGAGVKQHPSLGPRLPIRVSASPSSSIPPPTTPGRHCVWCGGREHASVDCDKVCNQCGSSSHTRGGCGSTTSGC